MKKRSGLQRAIIALTILDLILLVAFFVLHIADIRLTDRDSARPIDQGSIPVVTDARAPEDASLPAGEAEQIIRGTEGSDRPVQGTLTVDGDRKSVV